MAHEILKLTRVHPPRGYSHAVKAGNTLYVSGQVALDIEGKLVGRGDIEAQARQVFTNLKNILEEAGGSLANAVKLTVLLTHHGSLDAYRTVRAEFFPGSPPAITLHVISSLADKDYLIEVEAIAVLD